MKFPAHLVLIFFPKYLVLYTLYCLWESDWYSFLFIYDFLNLASVGALPACVSVHHTHARCHRGSFGSLGLELQKVVSTVWVMWFEPGLSGKVTSALNCPTTSQLLSIASDWRSIVSSNSASEIAQNKSAALAKPKANLCGMCWHMPVTQHKFHYSNHSITTLARLLENGLL